jgi:hypothetical protein
MFPPSNRVSVAVVNVVCPATPCLPETPCGWSGSCERRWLGGITARGDQPPVPTVGPFRSRRGADTLMRDVGQRPRRPRLVLVAKIDTPPGPTKNPTTMSTMPRTTCPWKSWTIPAITRTTAMIHRMVAMARWYPAAVAQILVHPRPVATAPRIATVHAPPERRARRWGPLPRRPPGRVPGGRGVDRNDSAGPRDL